MSPNREELLFQLVLEKPAEKRAAYLDAVCEGDAVLRLRIEALLAAHDQTGGALAEPAPAVKGTMKIEFAEVPDETIGQKIGRYKILEKVGEGGCGVVYVAEQTEPVRRRVALKVIKLGMDTKQVVARFEAERQALALMDHPNIAKVLDAGTTDTGRPYFIMELVRGIRITDYCDQNNLPTKERLDLFIKVCQAIQHAHQKGIIHRDIKPSNILVTLHDGVPVPKVIDFGIAKATTDQRLTDKTIYTQLQQFVGTPAYMSPEQAEMSGLDVDTRSDIYSLGVLLYELLTGKTPFDGQELMSQGIDLMRKTIREKEPSKPSTRLATLKGEDLTTTAKRRSVEVSKLVNLMRGDLDWIVMKCLEKDRTRRYDTANGLAMDIQRHRNNEVILARPPSKLYEFQKTVRRHKVGFAATAAVIVALAVGVVISTWQTVLATRAQRDALAARQQAVANEQKARTAEHEQARLRAAAEQEAAWSKKIAQAGVLLANGNDDSAEKILDQVPLQPTMIGLLAQLGNDYARRAAWQQALTNYAKIAQLEPSQPPLSQLAVLNFQLGHMEAYEHCRDEILRKLSTTTDNRFAEYLAVVCLLAPPTAAEAKGISQLVYPPISLGAARVAYQQAHFDDARECLRKIVVRPEFSRYYHADWQVGTMMLLAMSEHQLQQTNDARATFVKGLQLADAKLIKAGGDLGDNWDGWIMAHLLMREAAKLMPDVLESNSVFAAVVREEPTWVTTLNQKGLKFSSRLLNDGTWSLDLSHQPIVDLTPLSGARISVLKLMHTDVSDLTPLRGMPLTELRLAVTKVADLSPLQGMPLDNLDITSASVSDLSPLRGLPLTYLKMNSCKNIADLSPLAGVTTLQTVFLPPNATNIEVLRGLTNLTRIGFKYDPAVKGPDKTAAQFWADYNQKQVKP